MDGPLLAVARTSETKIRDIVGRNPIIRKSLGGTQARLEKQQNVGYDSTTRDDRSNTETMERYVKKYSNSANNKNGEADNPGVIYAP
jgi:hypothetical protein